MNTPPATSKPKSTLLKDFGLVVIGALLSYIVTVFVEWKNKPQEDEKARLSSARYDTMVVKATTTIKRLDTSNQQLSGILTELQTQSSKITTQTQSITASIGDLVTAFRMSAVDTSNVSRIISSMKMELNALVSNSIDVTRKAGESKSLAAVYEQDMKSSGNLERIILPRGRDESMSVPIDGQYFVGVRGENFSGSKIRISAVFNARQKIMYLADTALIYTPYNEILKFTFQGVQNNSYVFGLNRLK